MAELTILETVRDSSKVPDESYDTQLLIYINSVMFGLYQLGAVTYKVVDPATRWSDLTYAKDIISEMVKQAMTMRVKYLFDAPGSQQDILYGAIAECENRILIELDLKPVIVIPVTPSP
jgi:hypothetical protein